MLSQFWIGAAVRFLLCSREDKLDRHISTFFCANAACPPKCEDCIDTECETAECVVSEGGYTHQCVKTRAQQPPLS
jgi:hypothetical protein